MGLAIQSIGQLHGISATLTIGNHGDTGSLYIGRGMIDGINNLLHGVYGPYHVNKALLLIGSRALFGQAAIRTVGRTPLRIVNKKVHAPVGGTPIHPSPHETERDGRGMTYLNALWALYNTAFSHQESAFSFLKLLNLGDSTSYF